MAVQLIALDLDDTLLKTDLTISAVNKHTVEIARKAGIQIVLASGRNIYSMNAYCKELHLVSDDNYMICNNGAQIIKNSDNSIVREVRLDSTTCKEIVTILDEEGLHWQIYEMGKIFVSQHNRWSVADSHLTGQNIELIHNEEQFFSLGVLKFVVPGKPEVLSDFCPLLAKQLAGKAEVLISKPYFLEILPSGVDKGSALVFLAQMLGINLQCVMTIGDAMNDLGMVQIAGFGCAPSNAIPQIKDAARYVSVYSNEEDAVSHLITTVALFP